MNQDFSKKEIQTIRECLNALSSGEIIEDWEFQTILGFERNELTFIEKEFKPSMLEDRLMSDLVSTSIGHLLAYPVKDKWNDYVSVSPQVVLNIMNRIDNRT